MKLLFILILVFINVFLIGCQSNPNAMVVQGRNGVDGRDGKDGNNGMSCVVTTLAPDALIAPYGGALLTCGDSSVIVGNGAPGQNAPPTAYTVTALIDPCGDTPNKFDEVLLRLQNGTLLATISDNVNGNNTRLGIVPSGSWVTTDGTSCYFTVDANLNVSW